MFLCRRELFLQARSCGMNIDRCLVRKLRTDREMKTEPLATVTGFVVRQDERNTIFVYGEDLSLDTGRPYKCWVVSIFFSQFNRLQDVSIILFIPYQ